MEEWPLVTIQTFLRFPLRLSTSPASQMRIKELIIFYAGVIIYSCDGKSEWQTANGTRCKSGYLVIMDTGTEKVKQFRGKSPGQVHGAVYRSAFGEERNARIVIAEGFSVMNGEFKINSGVFNPAPDGYHDSKKSMNPCTDQCVEKVIDYWKEAREHFLFCKNFKVQDLLKE